MNKRSKKLLVLWRVRLERAVFMTAFCGLALDVAVMPGMAMPGMAMAATWMQHETSQMVAFHGRFVQRDFGYSVQAPPHGIGYVMDHVSGDHSFLIILGEKREVMVFPSYVVEDPPPAPCDASQVPFTSGEMTPVRPARLAGRPACRVRGWNGDVVWDLIEAEGNDRGTVILYLLQLTTTRRAAAQDERSFQDVAESFRFVAINP